MAIRGTAFRAAVVLAAVLAGPAACGDGGGGRDETAGADLPADLPDAGPTDLPGDPGADGGPEAGSDVAPDGPADLPPDPGGDGGPRLEPPLLLLEKQVEADLGGFDDDPRMPLDPRQGFRHPLRVSSCGTVAALFRDFTPRAGGLLDASLAVLETPLSGDPALPRGYIAPVTGVPAPPPVAGAVVFSESGGQCLPRVWRASDTRVGFDQWIRKADGTWTNAEVLLDLAPQVGAEPVALRTVAVDADRSGRIHLLFLAVTASGAAPWIHAWVDQGTWVVERLPALQDVLSEAPGAAYAFGNDGAVHVVRPLPDGLVWARHAAGGWSREEAVAPPAEAVLDLPDLALGAGDTPLLAFRRIQLLEEGLWQFSRLEAATRAGAQSWTVKTVAEKAGIYGSANDRLTGGWPRIASDSAGRARVAFLDAALRRTGDGWGAIYGGPRLGVPSPSGWSSFPLLQHPDGAAASARYDVPEPPALAFGPDGKAFAALVLERERPKDLQPGWPGTATWRLWLLRGSL